MASSNHANANGMRMSVNLVSYSVKVCTRYNVIIKINDIIYSVYFINVDRTYNYIHRLYQTKSSPAYVNKQPLKIVTINKSVYLLDLLNII